MPRSPPNSSGSIPDDDEFDLEREEDPYKDVTASDVAFWMDRFQLQHDKFKQQVNKQLANFADLLKKVKSIYISSREVCAQYG